MSKALTTPAAFKKLILHPDFYKQLPNTMKGDVPITSEVNKKNRARAIKMRYAKGELSLGFMSDLLRECNCKQMVKEAWEV